MPSEEIPLADGLILRPGRPNDVESIVALNVAAHGPGEEGGIRYLATQPENWSVVVDGDRVVSTSVLLDHRARYGDVPLELGQIEYVATDPDYRRRGLIRAQFEFLHGPSAALGHLLTIVTGIPYFYLRFGYGHGLQHPDRYRLVDRHPFDTRAWSVAPAGPDDQAAVDRLHQTAHAAADLVLYRSLDDWAWLLGHAAKHGEELFVARRGGVVEGYGRLQRRPESLVDRCELFEAASDTVGAGHALLNYARSGDEGAELSVLDRPGTPFSVALSEAGEATQDYFPIYARIPDPVTFLDHVRPVLSHRLAASPYAAEQGELVISLYDSTILLTYDRGEVTSVRSGPAMEDPFEEGHAGVSPDALPALLLGRFGARALEARTDDVELIRDGPLLEVLFPRMRADVHNTI